MKKTTHPSRRSFLAGAALAGLFAGLPAFARHARHGRKAAAAPAAPAPTSLPWRNWSGGQQAQPRGRFAPGNEAELIEFMQRSYASKAGPHMRPVGSGHSFSGLVPTDGELLVLDRLAGVLAADKAAMTATLGAGTRLADIGPALEALGQGMFNLPDIDRQTLAGAISTATHGTGIAFTTLSNYVTALRLVTPSGQLLDLDAKRNPTLFAAARVSLGALGVITQVTLQNRPAFRLKETDRAAKIEDVLADFESNARKHRHFEMFPLVHSDYAIVQTIDETDEPVNNPEQTPEEAAAFDVAIASWAKAPVADRRALINGTAEQLAPQTSIDASYRILANTRNARFNEMEYSVPLENGAACLREILKTIETHRIDIVFPLEYRYVNGDDLWLSMFSGAPRAAISVHQFAHIDYRPYFSLIEPIFWKYGGRPHWGKVHTLGHRELAKLYPHFAEFLAVRQKLDPKGRMLNAHLSQLFGV